MKHINWKIIWDLPKRSLRERVRIDIRLHNCSIRYYKKWIRYYIRANDEKYDLLNILDGKITDPKLIRKTIKALKKSRKTHLYSRRDIAWDKAWVKVYDEWISCLDDILNQQNQKQSICFFHYSYKTLVGQEGNLMKKTIICPSCGMEFETRCSKCGKVIHGDEYEEDEDGKPICLKCHKIISSKILKLLKEFSK